MTCERCGKCCLNVGTVWTFSQHPIIKAINAELPLVFYRDARPCDMLIVFENGRATCLLQQWFGHKWKPQVCRNYPFGEKCFLEIEKELSHD